ncbi:MAG: hypothetical protein B7Y83_08385 [Flavobacteriales bacterium 32-34-25]|nr:MAG: hypothetical protein B7Y83_08385 [Flavobacteriales bacterium 32-34-25]
MFFSAYSQKDNFRGHVSDRHDGANFPGVIVELSQNEKVVYKSQTDIDGDFSIKNVKFGIYEFKLKYIDYETYVNQEFHFNKNNKIFEFVYPSPCKESVKVCPKNHSDKLIPIVYGLPRENLVKKAKKSKVYLGGCILTDCDPKWYCKKHSIKF